MMKEAYCEALSTALEMEEEGKKFYEDALSRVTDEFSRRTLKFLIEEENRHIEKILRFNDYLLGRGDFDVEAECSTDVPERLKALIDEAAGSTIKKIEDTSSDIEVYEAAMEFERRGYQFYSEASLKEEDERLKKFFDFLVSEEIKHFQLLQNTKKYLEDPSYYFEDAGGWIFS